MDAGRELDALVAEKVMGMGSQRIVQLQPDGSFKHIEGVWRECPELSTDIAAAWQVVAAFTDFYIEKGGEGYTAIANAYADAHAATAPHAICPAALDAVGTKL